MKLQIQSPYKVLDTDLDSYNLEKNLDSIFSELKEFGCFKAQRKIREEYEALVDDHNFYASEDDQI